MASRGARRFGGSVSVARGLDAATKYYESSPAAAVMVVAGVPWEVLIGVYVSVQLAAGAFTAVVDVACAATWAGQK